MSAAKIKEGAMSPWPTDLPLECVACQPSPPDKESLPHCRRLGKADLAAAASVIRRSFADVASRFGLTVENCPGNGAFIQEETLRRDLARGVAMYGLFMRDGLCGFVAAKPKSHARRPLRDTAACGNSAALPIPSPSTDGASVWYLEKLAVLPGYRGGGHGSALLARALDHMRGAGANLVSIGVIADNLPLVAWYERRGFVCTQTRVFATLPFTVQYMERVL